MKSAVALGQYSVTTATMPPADVLGAAAQEKLPVAVEQKTASATAVTARVLVESVTGMESTPANTAKETGSSLSQIPTSTKTKTLSKSVTPGGSS